MDSAAIARDPGLECKAGGHLWADMLTRDHVNIGCWCLWCGTATYDNDRIGKVKTVLLRFPDGFHRERDLY